MTRSRGKSRGPLFSARNVARVVVAGAVAAGTQVAFVGTAHAAPDDVWDRIANCESGGRWNTSTGNGYSGGLQFSPSTWRAHGGKGSAAHASRAEQIRVAERVLASQGWGAWPSCSKKVGARGKASPRPATKTTQTASRQTARTEVKPNVVQPAPRTPPAPISAAPGVPAQPGEVYTVAPGDSLSKIATMKNVPGGWQGLHEHNKDQVSNPSSLKVGQRLKMS